LKRITGGDQVPGVGAREVSITYGSVIEPAV
jgi:hypothetical protein